MKRSQKSQNKFKRSPLALAVVAAIAINTPAQAENFPAEINLFELDGDDGFVITGEGEEFTGGGTSVSSAGDFNGDGVTDIVVGIGGAVNSTYNGGASYIVFGGDDFGSTGEVNMR